MGASVASDVTRKAARKEQPAALLSQAQAPIPRPHTSVGRELRVRHIVRPDVDLGSNSVLFSPLRSKSFKSFFLLPEEEKHMGLCGRGFSAPSCCFLLLPFLIFPALFGYGLSQFSPDLLVFIICLGYVLWLSLSPVPQESFFYLPSSPKSKDPG